MISILIVNWNTRELLRSCLKSLQSLTIREVGQRVNQQAVGVEAVGVVDSSSEEFGVPANLDKGKEFGVSNDDEIRVIEHEIVVVDCASSDGSAAMVAHEFPDVKLIASDENLGFAAGNNRAYEAAVGEWIWLLNPDTEILDNAAESLLERLQSQSEIGAVASALVDARDGHIQRSCRTFPTPAALWAQASGLAALFPRSKRFGFYKMGWWNYRDARPVEQPMASSLMLRRVAIEEAGGLFDEQFPIFFNDVDLCWRLWQSGWQIWFEPRSRVKHWGGAATSQVRPEMIARSHQSLRKFYAKHYRGKIAAPLYFATMAMSELAGRARILATKKRKKKQKEGQSSP